MVYLVFLPDGELLVEAIASGSGSRRRKRDIQMLRDLAPNGRLNGVVPFGVVTGWPGRRRDDAATYLNVFHHR